MNKAQQASVELRAMDELAAQDSPMHRLSPLSKLFVTVLYIVVTVSFHKYDISGVFVMVLFPLVGYQVGMIPVHTCFHKLRVVMPLVCAVGLFNPFFDKRIVLSSAWAAAAATWSTAWCAPACRVWILSR